MLQSENTYPQETAPSVSNITVELNRRAFRPPDSAAEHRGLATLIRELSENPRNMLQRLAEVALDLCQADTAGVTLLEGKGFTWEAGAGAPTTRGKAMPGEAGLGELVVPFDDHGEPVGSVWVLSHEGGREFDVEDARVIGVLAHFASAAWQLWRASDAAARNRQRQDEFIATLGHELRNPLSVIATASRVLKMDDASRDDLKRSADLIARQVHHLRRLVNDLLDIERIENGKLQLDLRAVDVRDVVTNTLESRRADAERRHQSLDMELGSDLVVVDADAVRLVQVVSNLIDNAIKYTPEAGHITVTVTADPRHARIVVRDDGAGIPSDQIERIFEPFAQLSQSRGAARGGMGLGLALVRRLVQLHGGSVGVASGGSGLGSSFTVTLPLQATPQPKS